MANPATSIDAIWPAAFSTTRPSSASELYLRDPPTRKLVEFFERKGLAAIKEEDRLEQWYDDWLDYQAKNNLYASVLSPKSYSSQGREFDLLRYARFMEVFAYFSPGHTYSLQVTFLGFFSILMGSNEALKKEALATLEAGGLFAFGVSEKDHGSDLLGNEFTIRATGPNEFVANGTKYYIGNANCASMISILARKLDERTEGARAKRAPFALFALRPKQSKGFGNLRKIHTLGVRAGFVGEFEVKNHPLPQSDIVAEGRDAWDAVLGTVTLGKFFLGFGSIGICEHALEEAVAHLNSRILYGKPVIEMPHIRAAVDQARTRLIAMKLYAYRALDYVHAASADDRRYLLYCAVQKAKVSTEGVKVMALLSECIGAKGFESDTYFEMALRDAQLVPGLESSAHINLGLAAQFIPAYFGRPAKNLPPPPSLAAAETASTENEYLMQARSTAINTIAFPSMSRAYVAHRNLPNVRGFVRQAKAFRDFARTLHAQRNAVTDTLLAMALGQCVATIVYGQLIAENALCLKVPADILSSIFHFLVSDLSAAAMPLASLPELDAADRTMIERMIVVPSTSQNRSSIVP
jgi:acyl-CoA dehydrogenase